MRIEINRSYSSRLPAMIMAAASLLVLTACGGGDGGSGETPLPLVLTKDICFDNSIYEANAAYTLAYQDNGSTVRIAGLVVSINASYDGVTNLVEFRERAENTTISTVTRYIKPLAPGIMAQYATVASQGSFGVTTTIYTPPFEDRRAEMSIGETRSFTGSGTRMLDYPPTPSSGPQPYNRKDQIEFVSIERITTPAGTFTACRFKNVDSQVTEWWHRSLVIRSDLSNGQSRILQSGVLNGTPLKDL